MGIVTTPSVGTVIACAIDVHRKLGPGLFESVYQPCLAHEFKKRGLKFREQAIVPVTYDGIVIDRALTYLRVTGLRKGLLINFNVPLLKLGLKSFVM